MNLNLLNRKVHYWASFIVALPLLVIILTGVILQLKKHWEWVQPPEQRGSVRAPQVGLDEMLAAIVATEGSGVRGWDDVNRVDVRPARGIAKFLLRNEREFQVDLGTAAVLQNAQRRSDWIESLHDGSYFAGDWTRLGLFLPTGLLLLWLWISGMWMWWVPFGAQRRREARKRAVTGGAGTADTTRAAAVRNSSPGSG